MSFFDIPPAPSTKLGYYRLLSPLAGVRVSPIQLGAMSIGDKWDKLGFGSMDKESSFKLLDAYFDMGGNFIDTANSYQDESSEEFIGEWVEKRGIRDQVVIATKYTMNFKRGNDNIQQKVNYTGNGNKSLKISVKSSLRKLRTDYIDILYVHWWDYETSIEEVMNSLHNLVVEGKVLYLGISDTPAWVVSRANMYAQVHGKTPFSIYQGHWSLLDRSFEREIIPMARTLGLALAPWDVLGGGKFRTDAEEEERRQSGEKGRAVAGLGISWERNEDEKKISRALEKVAGEVGAKNIRSVALAYVMQKTPYVFPLIGGRKVEHLVSNLEALDITLSKEQIEYLESILPFDPGFPNAMIGDGSSYNIFLASTAHMSKQPRVEPIRP
ncbi:NADP-dependent oxidoreductase domain-containing protein [Desarmillaria tabescens]|uniref:NADP-dependent oxidoreductase domain-containing protein n=1 Tax=Armillaria tabescens TaxID=1929756 RepID=A0AA39MN61_ARMTA|nr:NADP-dependent oxidoreductase domain-containing protein [Desarmillaria tabescens]KAK0440462.1 NADP-dependent oxidoreductase domain-containing protein [Desarmillaria tabescens]